MVDKNLPPRWMGDPVFANEFGWGFWDETWSEAYGPYDTEEHARTVLAAYCATVLEGEPWYPTTTEKILAPNHPKP